MSEKDYGILIEILKNSHREAFLTDFDLETIWTNSERKISDILLSADKRSVQGKPEKEVSIPLGSGDTLKITPVKTGGKVRYFLFEVYNAAAVLEIAAPLAAFREYAKQYNELKDSITELAERSAAAGIDPDELGIRQLMSSFSNKTAMFMILSSDREQPYSDISIALRRTCNEFGKLIACRSDTEFEFFCEEGLFCRVYRAGLGFAVSNLLSNAWLYCNAAPKKITLEAYKKDGSIFIEITDNGTSADPVLLEKSRQVFSVRKDGGESEGLGIAICDIFASRQGGGLCFIKSEKGLTARITLPCSDPRSDLMLYSPSAFEKNESGIVRDILLKGSDITGIRYSEFTDKFIR